MIFDITDDGASSAIRVSMPGGDRTDYRRPLPQLPCAPGEWDFN
ncbi:hypothetical protein ACWGH8_40315 [Nonomuraea muscovyensis]|uniref:Uncharacterized protein n=1 Tax=Nonomuraea muscovyensis TaxID=1124761 RepID=A0A7X0EYF1_9ACTN|nr:hypothetical protein [Nonomuraea muscovyensis]MBB6349082.1 hypothetical protein [Nonomuraea muscovyensis]